MALHEREIALFFGVDVDTLERWAEEHKDFEWAIQTLPTNLFIHLWCNDYGLIKWLYDCRRGALDQLGMEDEVSMGKAPAKKTSSKPGDAASQKDAKTGRFLPGNSGFGGRPKGARSKLTTEFFDDFYAAWQEHGAQALKARGGEEPSRLRSRCSDADAQGTGAEDAPG